jgi:hypothetical protein
MGLDGSGCFSLVKSLWSPVHPLSDLVASGVRWELTVYVNNAFLTMTPKWALIYPVFMVSSTGQLVYGLATMVC